VKRKPEAIYVMNDEVLPLVYGPAERSRLAGLATFANAPFTPETLRGFSGDLSGVEAVFSSWGMPRLDESLLVKLPGCKIVFHAAGTVRTFETPAAWQRGLRLTSAAEANAIPVAEYTLAAIVFCLKHAWQRIFELRGNLEVRRDDATTPGAFESTVGLLSLSRVGRNVAERLHALDVRVIAYDPLVEPSAAAALNVELCPLAEVFARADVVSCHMPLLPETAGVIRARHFSTMKPGASFVNTARGDVVDEMGMISVLRMRPDLFAVLDVVRQEPIARDSPLLALPNVVVTPHIAGSQGAECRRMGRMMIEEAQRYLHGAPLLGEVSAAQMAFTA
jgi:phosphoglycerate dehydrogenase-like enzyme